MTFSLNEIEKQYLKLIDDEIIKHEFEEWIYQNEQLIKASYSDDIYVDLISLNYNTAEAKHSLSKILAIDHLWLRKYQIQQLLIHIIKSEKIQFGNVVFHKAEDGSEPAYTFQIGRVKFLLENPFHFSDFGKLEAASKQKLFIDSFRDIRKLLDSILEALKTESMRIDDDKTTELMDPMTRHKFYMPSNDEYRLDISKHRTIIKKSYIHQNMKNDWL